MIVPEAYAPDDDEGKTDRDRVAAEIASRQICLVWNRVGNARYPK